MFKRKCFAACLPALPAMTLGGILLIAWGVAELPAADPPLADLKAAVAALDLKPGAVRLEPNPSGKLTTAASVTALKSAAARNPKLDDYAAFFLATAQFDTQDYASVPATVDRIFLQSPPSPLVGQAALLAARAFENNSHPADAVALLRNRSRALPQPQGDLETARAMLAAGDQAGAAIYAQRVYYGYPASLEAADAQATLTTLQTNLAERYPPVLGSTMLARALKLLDAGDTAKARKELVALEPQLSGAERDTARVKIGVADYVARNNLSAQRYLKALSVESPVADAERIYYLFLCARRASDRAGMDAALAQFARLYPSSPFRMEALTASANISLVENQPDTYEPLYRTCYQAAPAASSRDKIGLCHWRVTWLHYLQHRPDATDLLREHLRLFPDSENASAALYYLSRMAESKGDRSSSATYDREIARRYPNRYYGVLARVRMEESSTNNNPAPRSIGPQLLPDFPPPVPVKVRSFDPNPTARFRIERARLLASADLEDWAEFELRYAATREDQPQVTALELARLESSQGSSDQALHDLKHFVPDYLSLPFETAALDATQREFWQLAFPLPYRADLEKLAREYNMDPFLMAALIRQESEFNPKAVSVANARGLTQIMPATGRDLSRRLGLRTYTLANLFDPQVNLRLGTYYLKSIADHFAMGPWEGGGRWEAALAGYNAGPARVDNWSKWSEFREPSEFVETIPFTQTREYVQIVMRNADVYRRLYPAPPGLPVARVSYSLDKSVSLEMQKRAGKPVALEKTANENSQPKPPLRAQ